MMGNNKAGPRERIRQAFSRAASDYDKLADLQNHVAIALLQKVHLYFKPSNKPIASVLDVGCGTGMMTSRLKNSFPNAYVAGCDIAHPMILTALGKTSGQAPVFITADGAALPFKKKRFSLVTSSLAYQWISNIEEAFSEANRVLNKGGIFAFSTLTQGTLKELRQCYRSLNEKTGGSGLPPIMPFLDTYQIQSALRKTGFDILFAENSIQLKRHEGLFDLLKTIKSIGAGNPFTDGDKSLARGSKLKQLAIIYKESFGTANSIPATYKITSIISSKK